MANAIIEEEASSKVDMVVLGASGFTGKYVVRELLRVRGGSGVALAGRSRARLAETLKWAASGLGYDAVPAMPLMEADVGDPSSLLAMCRRARLVLNCVGPYRLYGEPVVAACVEAGTDYLDITGEPEFMERMELSYHVPAREAGVLLVSGCGYDCIPAEIGLLHHISHWQRQDPSATPNSVDCFLRLASTTKIVGNLGTFESAVLGLANAKELRKIRRQIKKSRAPVVVPGAPAKKASALSWNKTLGMWSVLLPSADSAVVRRTMSTIAAGGPPSIAEEERGLSSMDAARRRAYVPVHFGVYSAISNIWQVLSQLWLGASILLLATVAFGRRLLMRFPGFFSMGLFKRGGPSEEQVKAASFKLWFVGNGYSEEASTVSKASRPDVQIVTCVSGPEIGYVTTPICLVQCALVVLEQRRELPRGGVYTPGVVFGTTDLRQRLEANGIAFDFVSKQSLPR